MLKRKITGLAMSACICWSYVVSAQTSPPSSGLYQILSGTYRECCGFVGTDTVYPLPNSDQAFLKLTVDPLASTATLSVLGPDRQTEFSRASCPSDGAIPFGFPFGLPAANGFFFHVDPGPPPLEMYWNYTASNSANLLRIDGLVGIAAGGCSDMPTRFSHSNVLAVLVPPPRLTVLGFATNHAARLMIQGNAGQTNLVEASVDLKTWVPVSTNVLDYSDCPLCPFAIFEDPESTNSFHRFYRVSEVH